MSIKVIKPGMLTTFQDRGRLGYQHLGVPVAGAMDAKAHRLANLLAGNAEDLATLEITVSGPVLRVDQPACIAICGADLSPHVRNKPIPLNRPIVLKAGSELSFGERRHGARCYLAVFGGFVVPEVLGSASTYVRSGMGGWHGRALRKDDQIDLHVCLLSSGLAALSRKLWDIKVYLPAALGSTPRKTVRIVKGAQWKDFSPESCVAMMTQPFRISPDSERMGYRLQGPAITLAEPRQLISEATSFGTIQVPSGGQPIVLMADRQTTGGYPKIANVAAVDLPVLAQMLPVDVVRFEPISLDHAQELDAKRETAFVALSNELEPLRHALASHIKQPI